MPTTFQKGYLLVMATVVAFGFSAFSDPVEPLAGPMPQMLSPRPTTSPTIAPCDPNMAKPLTNGTPNPASGPIVIQTSAASLSPPLRDMIDNSPKDPQPPREMNPLNTAPLKEVEPTAKAVQPCSDPSLKPVSSKKKKESRTKKHRSKP